MLRNALRPMDQKDEKSAEIAIDKKGSVNEQCERVIRADALSPQMLADLLRLQSIAGGDSSDPSEEVATGDGLTGAELAAR